MDLLRLLLAGHFGATNVYPDDDAIEHRMGADCLCRPNVEIHDDCPGVVIVHHRCDDAYDPDDAARLVH